MTKRAFLLVAAAGVVATAAVADTLVLRSGRRVEGDLISVRGTTIEFADARGSTGRYDRNDVDRIELGATGYDTNRPGGRPSGLRETYTTVNAATAWNDTGVDVRAGMDVYFEATGKVRWGPDRQDGPAGEGGNRTNPNRPLPGRPGGALIGRIGASGPFLIGSDRGPIRMRESGRLSLGVNDDFLQDNSGSWRVTIYY
ncbi:MAG TPA: hypothetical protein VE359_07645 [Vicinamibacteria bacterium]|nr:hypothetical protein [Vicinamibacteria bacterium]